MGSDKNGDSSQETKVDLEGEDSVHDKRNMKTVRKGQTKTVSQMKMNTQMTAKKQKEVLMNKIVKMKEMTMSPITVIRGAVNIEKMKIMQAMK